MFDSTCNILYSLNGMHHGSGPGWAVKAGEKISRGRWVCEYVGDLLHTEVDVAVAASRHRLAGVAGGTSYMVMVGKEHTAWDSKVEISDSLVAIDATVRGGVARFLNHSCAPNLFTQQVYLYGSGVRPLRACIACIWCRFSEFSNTPNFAQVPHVMFFAARDIEKTEELTWDYSAGVYQARNHIVTVKRPSSTDDTNVLRLAKRRRRIPADTEAEKALVSFAVEQGHGLEKRCCCGASTCVGWLPAS
eukprot:SAG31_NODE_101_length_25195_cov_67.436758_12_plen_247_part_00